MYAKGQYSTYEDNIAMRQSNDCPANVTIGFIANKLRKVFHKCIYILNKKAIFKMKY